MAALATVSIRKIDYNAPGCNLCVARRGGAGATSRAAGGWGRQIAYCLSGDNRLVIGRVPTERAGGRCNACTLVLKS